MKVNPSGSIPEMLINTMVEKAAYALTKFRNAVEKKWLNLII